jgi:hypothetical protein
VRPAIEVGGFILNGNVEPDLLDFIHHPNDGFMSMTVP